METSEDSTRSLLVGIRTLHLDGAALEVVDGPALGQACEMKRSSLSVGSGAQVDFRVGDRGMSRRHFELFTTPDGLMIRDLDSHNGTFVHGCRIRQAQICSPTVINAGQSRIAVRLAKSSVPLEVSNAIQFGDAIGQSVAMRHVFAVLSGAASMSTTVLLEGESGTGKEVLAQALHAQSARAEGPFVVVDCAAIPENLVESELFGHERGAFTGAVGSHVGAFERANGGTIFLDELGELPLSQQSKLLRVLEGRTIQRVGGSKAIPVDVRVIAATNVDLDEAVRKRTFRSDLYYRLSVLRVIVPPLRERPDDILLLARRFYERFSGLKDELPQAMRDALLKHSWPGNVRELRNSIERWVALGGASVDDLHIDRRTRAAFHDASLPYHEAKRRALEAFDRAYLPAVLERAGGVVSKAAEIAGVPRPSFHRMLARARGETES